MLDFIGAAIVTAMLIALPVASVVWVLAKVRRLWSQRRRGDATCLVLSLVLVVGFVLFVVALAVMFSRVMYQNF